VTGGELHAETREHIVEARIFERQILRISGEPLDFDAGFARSTAAGGEQLGVRSVAMT